MNRIKRILKAPALYRTSKGFGVHSPFAFTFISNVLRQSYAYYSYPAQDHRNLIVRNDPAAVHPSRPKCQHLVFRIVNKFHPETILQIGRGTGLNTMAALDASGSSQIIDYDPSGSSPLYTRITSAQRNRIFQVDNLRRAISLYKDKTADQPPFVLVNRSCGNNLELSSMISRMLEREAIVLFTDIDSTEQTRALWESLNSNLTDHGMTFTDDRMGVIVGIRHLPRQEYKLWL